MLLPPHSELPSMEAEDKRYVSQTGLDPRYVTNAEVFETEEELSVYGLLSGNFILPVKAFEITGGFDENIEGRGQDGEFGRNLVSKGIKGVYSQRVIGYHVSHAKDPVWETNSVRKTIRYIGKKYGFEVKEEHLPKKYET